MKIKNSDINSYNLTKKLVNSFPNLDLKKPIKNQKEIEFTKKILLPLMKEIYDEEIKNGLVIRGPINPVKDRFFRGDYFSDITFSLNRERLVAVEVKLLKKSKNRHQNLSTAIGQSVIYTIGKFNQSVLLVIDERLDVNKEDVEILRNKLFKLNVVFIYFNYSLNKKFLQFIK